MPTGSKDANKSVVHAKMTCASLRSGVDEVDPVCWVNSEFMWAVLSYVGMIVGLNIMVTVKAVVAAYQSAEFR